MSYKKSRQKEFLQEQFYKSAIKTLRKLDNRFASKHYPLNKPLSPGKKSAITRAFKVFKDQPYQNYKYIKIPKYHRETKSQYSNRVKTIKTNHGQDTEHGFNGVFYRGNMDLRYTINKKGDINSRWFTPVPGQDYKTREEIISVDKYRLIDGRKIRKYLNEIMEKYKPNVIWPLFHGGQIEQHGGFHKSVMPDNMIEALNMLKSKYADKIQGNINQFVTAFRLRWYSKEQ